MARASLSMDLPEARVLRIAPEKKSALKLIWVELTVEQAASMMENGWDVQCLTPGSRIDWTDHHRFTDDYVLYIVVAVSPFWDRFINVSRWIIPEMIKHHIPAKMTIDLAVVDGESHKPYLMDLAETDVEAEMRRTRGKPWESLG